MEMLLPDSAEVIKRRRALLHGLRSLLTPQQAVGALCMWERDFAAGESPFTGLLLYTKSVCDFFGKVGRRKELHSALLAALFLQEDKLPEDPTAEMRQVAAHFWHAQTLAEVAEPVTEIVAPPAKVEIAAPEPVVVPALNTTLSLLLRSLLSELSTYQPETCADCITFVCNVIGQLGLPVSMNLAIMNHLRSAEPAPLLGNIPGNKAANLVHLMYVWMAETLGPVLADRMLSVAVQTVERDPAASAYPVRQLL